MRTILRHLLASALALAAPPSAFAQTPVLGRLSVPAQTATVFGVRTVYYEAGQGPTVILLAKIGWDASSFWFRNLPDLARDHHVIALDLVGLGESDKPLIDYTMRTWTEWIAEFMRLKGVATATIAGVEMGGALAVQFALDFPEKCAGIVISGTNSGPGHPAAKPGLVSSSYQAMRGALLREFDDDSLVDDALVRARYEARLRSNDGYTISRHLADHRAPYSAEELSHVAAPALVIWCDHDDLTPPDWGQAYADALKSSRFVLLKACSRVPNLERPDDYNAALRAFLKR